MDAQLLRLLETLAIHDGMTIDAFLRRFTLRKSERRTGQPVDSAAIVERLQSVFQDDQGFELALQALASERRVTKAVLADVFYRLFTRDRGVPKNATRAELLRLIADERHILVRNERMGQMLARRPVPAE